MGSGGIEDKNFVEMRKSKRIDYISKIYCIKSIYNGETVEYDESLELELLNISAGGLGIASNKQFEKGTILVLRIKLEEVSYDKVNAKVMWNIKKGVIFRYGLEIINISGKLFSHLSRLDNSVTTTV
jgi:hypothetical protein